VREVSEIRAAEPAEVPALEDLQRRSSLVWEEYREALLAHPDAIEVAPEAVAEEWVRVAVDGGRIVGFCTVMPAGDGVGELDAIFVEPESMRCGIGRRLIDDALARARADGLVRVEVTANPRAEGFYQRVGFSSDEVTPTRFGPAIRMHLDVAD
jgi:GNAT superfamily N-acetyltransferase